jgi:hypothetical protein
MSATGTVPLPPNTVVTPPAGNLSASPSQLAPGFTSPSSQPTPGFTPVSQQQALPGFSTPAVPVLAGDAGPPVSLDRPNYLEALRFPFRQANWPSRLWLPSAIAFFPVVNIIVMRGWRLEMTRRLGRGWTDRLPEPAGVGRYFLDGLVLWLMTSIYFIPQFILLLFFGLDPVGTILALLTWLFTPERVSFFVLLGQLGLGALVQLLLPLIYWVLTYPLYRVAMVRFAYTGSVGVFFDFVNNLNIAREHFGLVLRIYIFEYLTNFLVFVLGIILAATGIGALAVPLLIFPMHYWTTGYLFGSLAALVQSRQLA